MRYGKNAVGTGELEHTRRYGELLNTAVGQKDLEDYATSDLIRPPKDPVRPRDSWRPAVGESASALCYNSGPWGSRHRRTRETPDTDWLLGDFYLD